MDEGVPVSHHNCTTLDLFFSLLLLSFNLSLYHSLSLSLQFRSPHPCSREINPRSPTSVEREQSLSLANCGSSCRVDSGGRPARRTLPHHSPTGHWAPQPQLPLNNSTVCLSQVAAAACRFGQQCREVYKAMFANMLSVTKYRYKLLSSQVLSGDQTRKAQFNQ